MNTFYGVFGWCLFNFFYLLKFFNFASNLLIINTLMKNTAYLILVSLLLAQAPVKASFEAGGNGSYTSFASFEDKNGFCVIDAYDSESESDYGAFPFDGFDDKEIFDDALVLGKWDLKPQNLISEEVVKKENVEVKSSFGKKLKRKAKSLARKTFTKKNAKKTAKRLYWGTKKTLKFSWKATKFLAKWSWRGTKATYRGAKTTYRMGRAAYKAYHNEAYETGDIEVYIDGQRIYLKGNKLYITTKDNTDFVKV